MNESKQAMLPDRDQMAEIVFNGAHKGLKDCWQWSDPDFDQEHPGRRGHYYKIADAVLAALRASAPQEDGWKLVPVEPTQEMVRAAYQEQPGCINAGFAQAYRAMISAVPNALSAPPSVALETGEIARLANLIVQRVSEWDDRTSPEDWPEALLITSDELREELLAFADDIIFAALTRPQPGGAVAGTERGGVDG